MIHSLYNINLDSCFSFPFMSLLHSIYFIVHFNDLGLGEYDHDHPTIVLRDFGLAL